MRESVLLNKKLQTLFKDWCGTVEVELFMASNNLNEKKGDTFKEITKDVLPKAVTKKNEIMAETFFSERQAEILILYHEHPDNLELQEIAQLLGIEKGTIYNHWSHAKDNVRKSKSTVERFEDYENAI